jgi:hypothetical protein
MADWETADSLDSAHRAIGHMMRQLELIAEQLQLVSDRVNYDLMVMEERLDILAQRVEDQVVPGLVRWANLQDPDRPQQEGGV